MSTDKDKEEQRAVIDRIVDGEHAVLIVGDTEEQIVVPVRHIPENAREGTWLQVHFDGDDLLSATIDSNFTAFRRDRIAGKIDLLRKRDNQK